MLGIRTARDAYLAVLAALAKVDPAKDFVQDVKIWEYSDEVKKRGNHWGWSVVVGRSINDTNTAPPGAYNWTAPAPPSFSEQEKYRQRWMEYALDAYEKATQPKMIEPDEE